MGTSFGTTVGAFVKQEDSGDGGATTAKSGPEPPQPFLPTDSGSAARHTVPFEPFGLTPVEIVHLTDEISELRRGLWWRPFTRARAPRRLTSAMQGLVATIFLSSFPSPPILLWRKGRMLFFNLDVLDAHTASRLLVQQVVDHQGLKLQVSVGSSSKSLAILPKSLAIRSWRTERQNAAVVDAIELEITRARATGVRAPGPFLVSASLSWPLHAPAARLWQKLAGRVNRPRNKQAVAKDELPISIYLADEAIHEQVEYAVEVLLATVGIEVVERDEPVIGSWFRRMKGKAAEFAQTSVGREAALTAMHAADSRLVLAQDAYVTATLLQNLGPVIASLQPTKDAVLRVGALLIVKVDWAVQVYQLTASQQAVLDHKPALATKPGEIITALQLSDVEAAAVPAADEAGMRLQEG
jgi:hypothetical protein